jgi:hyperosmotically inducible periplasmic protein
MDSKHLPAARDVATHSGHGRADGNGNIGGSSKANGNGTLNVKGSAHGNGDDRSNDNGSDQDSSATGIGQSAIDGDITARIKAAFSGFPDLIALRVDVDTRDGVVTLTRSVESRMRTEVAVAIAAHVAGVKYVNDHLIASPRPSRHEAEPHTHRIPSLWTATGRGRHE